MKYLFLLIFLICGCVTINSNEKRVYHYDGTGRYIGYSVERIDYKTTYRFDKDGRYVGNSVKD